MLTFPKYSSTINIQVIDLFGRGTGSLVWSSKMAGDSGRQIRYVDLMSLLTSMKNNLGSESHIEYLSSTQFYLEDKATDRKWLTCLPFPVQVVHARHNELGDVVRGSADMGTIQVHIREGIFGVACKCQKWHTTRRIA